MDPTGRLVNSLLLLPRGRYQENAFYTRVAYRLDHRTVLSARFDNALTTMALPGELSGRLDRVGFAGTATVDRTIGNRHAVSGSYTYLYVHGLQPGPAAGNRGVQNVSVGYIYTANPGLTVRLSGGVTRAVQSSFTGAAAVDKKIGGVWLSAGYQRYLALFGGLAPNGSPAAPLPFAAGLAANSVYQVASLRAWGNLTNRVGLQGTLQRALNGVTPENRGIKSVIGQFRVDYKLSDKLTVFARTDFYSQNLSEFSTFPMSRRRYFGGLEIALSRAPRLTEDPRPQKPLSASPPMQQQDDARLSGERSAMQTNQPNHRPN